jgi:hypothetical protein
LAIACSVQTGGHIHHAHPYAPSWKIPTQHAPLQSLVIACTSHSIHSTGDIERRWLTITY